MSMRGIEIFAEGLIQLQAVKDELLARDNSQDNRLGKLCETMQETIMAPWGKETTRVENKQDEQDDIEARAKWCGFPPPW